MTTAAHDLTSVPDPAALLAAMVVPGGGHFVAGDRKRGLFIAGGVLGLYATGLLLGGLSVVDRKENDWWFYGQALVGPITFGINALHENVYKTDASSTGARLTPPPTSSKYHRAIGKPLDLGVLFTAIAGMLNVIAIVDAGFPTRRRQP